MDASVKQVLALARRKQRILFIWMALGVVACNSAMVSLQTIQTSINIEGNKGAIALTAGYAMSILFGVFCCPILLGFAGANGALVISDITMLVFCLSNISQELSVLLVGAITSGAGRAAMLPAYTIAILDVAASSARLSRTKDDKYYQNYYQSRFYTMLESMPIIGNLLSYAILYGFKASNDPDASQVTDAPIGDNVSWTEVYENRYAYCGVNDCQDPEVLDQNLDQYQPPDRTSVNILALVATLLCCSSICIHAFVYPGIGRFSQKLKNIELKATIQTSSVESCEKTPQGGKRSNISRIFNDISDTSLINDGYSHELVDFDKSVAATATASAKDNVEKPSEEIKKKEVSGSSDESESYWKTLKDTGKFLLHPRAMMLNVSTLHHGMMLGFVIADVTRAYASCIAGVELTGLFTVMFGVTAMPSALLYGKLNFPHKRYVMYFASCGLEFALYCLCFFWIPNSSDLWVVAIIFAGYGIVNGFFRQNIISAYSLHFPYNRSVAFSVFGVFFAGGVGVQYGLSIIMCVKGLIYVQVAILLASVILFVIAEYLRRRKLVVDQYNMEDFEDHTTTRL